MMNEEDLIEKKISSKKVFDGKLLHVYSDVVELPNGNSATREVMRHIGAVAIIPVNERGEAVVERQFRYPFNKVITEVPAGKLDSSSEDRLEAAKRELREETGITAGKWTDLGEYYPSAAYTDEVLSIYMAEELSFGEQELDDDEFLNYSFVPLEELVDDCMNGKITDGKSISAILKAARLLKK